MAFWKLDRTNRIASQCIAWIGQCQKAGVYLVLHQGSDQELNTATAGAKLNLLDYIACDAKGDPVIYQEALTWLWGKKR